MEEHDSDRDSSHQDVRDLARGGLVNLIGKFGRLSKTAFVFVVKLLFGTEILGLYELAWSIVSAFLRIGIFGLDRGVVRFVVQGGEDKAKREEAVAAAIMLGLSVSVVVAAGIALAADHMAEFYRQMGEIGDEAPVLASSIRLMSGAVPFLTLTFIFTGATVALRIMRYDVYVNSIGSPVILLAGGCIAGLMGWGMHGLAVAQLLMGVGTCFLSLYYFRRHFSILGCLRRLRPNLQWPSLARFSFPVMMTEFINSVQVRLDVLMLGAFVDLEMIGVYAVARRLSSAVLKVPVAFDPIFSSIITDLSGRSQHRQLGARFASMSRWILIINLPFLAVLQLGGDNLLTLFGQDMSQGVNTFIALVWGMMLYGMIPSAEALLIMSGRPYLNLINTTCWLLFNLVFNYLMIPAYGILGAAVATSLSMNLVNLIRLAEVFYLYRIQPFTRSHIKPLLAASVAFSVAWYVDLQVAPTSIWDALLALICFLPVYIGLLSLFGIESEDRMLMRRTALRRFVAAAPGDLKSKP